MTARLLGSLAISVLCATTTARAQCSNTWESFGTLPGVNGPVAAVVNWDPDGAGPLTPRVVVGGSFSTAGAVSAVGVAAWDPATGRWSAIGTGQQMAVSVLLALPNGDLIAGGQTYSSGGTASPALQRWNGTTWTSFGGLSPGSFGVTALARLPNGNLAVGGHFTSAGATALPYVGVWNGTTWSSLGGGMNAPVHELTVLPNGDLLALGDFTIAGGVPANGVARWNGTAWSALGSGITGTYYGYGPRGDAAVVLPNGDLVVGGMFSDAGGAPASHLARWDGTSWSALGGGIGGTGYAHIGVRSLTMLPNGDLVVGGFFMGAGGLTIPNLARWDGSTWSMLGAGIANTAVNSLVVLPGGDLVAGGAFSVAGGIGASSVARWDGAAWSSLGDGAAPSARVHSLLTMPDGSFVAGGFFQAAGAVPVSGIARWDGASWSALGSFAPYGRVNAMRLLSNGNVLAGGNFVGRWDGTAWTLLASTFAGSVPHADIVEAVAELPNGDIVIGGDFSLVGSMWILGLARWDGMSWSELGGQQPGQVHALATLDNGDLVVGGDLWAMFPLTNGIARWDGTAWSAFGSGLQSWGSGGEVFAIAPLANGALIAGGVFTTAGGQPANNIARWNGAAWSPLGAGTNGTVRTIHVLPNGDVIAAGDFAQAGGVAVNGIARWSGTAWSAVAAGPTPAYPDVRAITALLNGDLMVGGGFTTLGGQPTHYLARLTTTCPATVQSTGAGCAGDTLVATLPWTGTTWRSDASNLPAAALVAAVSGFATTTLPLVVVFSTALPGCTLHVQPDHVDLVTGANGAASLQFALPNTPSLAGITFHHQMVPLALDSTLAVTATNALQLTVGTF
ncbi:MAG TPA: hypothetical protein VFD82_20420 [Planctomycetota bacterium]|nr:hypothetical protein [Planctomycetota bacterium]